MHIEINSTHKNVISVELTDEKVTQHHIQQLEKAVEELHEKTNDIHIIILLGSHTKGSLKMLYEALKFIKKEHKTIHKIAVVAHSTFIKAGVAMDNMVLPWQEKYFDIENLEDAWQWITHE